MSILAALMEQLQNALVPLPQGAWPLTRRDAVLAAIPNKTHAVIGMRRAGKTSFMKQLLHDTRAYVAPERAFYLTFDDDRLAGIDIGHVSQMFEAYFRRYPGLRHQQTIYCFLDEIQLVPGWDRLVRRLMDSENIQMVVSGSSAKMLSREVHTSLRGRSVETVIQPFSFAEYLRHHQQLPKGDSWHWTSAERSRLEHCFSQYMQTGGFAEAQHLTRAAKIELLQGYVDTVIFRDVVERHGVSQVTALRWLVRQCLRNPASGFTVHKFHQDLKAQGVGIAKAVLHEFLDHLEDAFLIQAVGIATESERQRNSNPRKIYPADIGLIDAFDNSGRSQTGHMLECLVFNELMRQKADVAYVKTPAGHEVDFLVRKAGEPQELIQVCQTLADPHTAARELRALEDAAVVHPRAAQRILVLHREPLPVTLDLPRNVEITPIFEWLLSYQLGDIT